MSVLLETSLGELVIDLDTIRCPKTSENFLKLCKSFKYNYLTFFSIRKDFIAQTGDPLNNGLGGQSIWSTIEKDSPNYSKNSFFYPEQNNDFKHSKKGIISMACRKDSNGKLIAASQFFITLSNNDNLEQLDNNHTPFGWIIEGQEEGGVLDKINETFVDKEFRPLQDIRIDHLVVLDDPFPDFEGLKIPERTPSPTLNQMKSIGLDSKMKMNDDNNIDEKNKEKNLEKQNQETNSLTLEMIGDLPFAEIRPPENILFICKLNPITKSEDLELIFSRFGKILNCQVIKDQKTGQSLQYAFIEFDKKESSEKAFLKMQNVLIDDKRIWVDFSQSVSKLTNSWNKNRTRGKTIKVVNNQNEGSSSDGSAREREREKERDRDREKERERDRDRDRDRDREKNRNRNRDSNRNHHHHHHHHQRERSPERSYSKRY